MNPSEQPLLGDEGDARDHRHMARALALAGAARPISPPNPWVGAVVVPAGETGTTFEGSTAPPGGDHAEVGALALATAAGLARGATLYSTLEPCSHHGRTPPCVDAIVAAGISRVVVGIVDPDNHVQGSGIAALEAAGVEVRTGVCADEVAEQLAPYVKHRVTGRPWVVLKMALSLDGRTAAPDGSSRWITGEAARADAHRLRACSDAVLVGAGTVRTDDPALTVRVDGGRGEGDEPVRQPLRVVLGGATPDARVQPALELSGDLGAVLDDLGSRGVVQVLVEGGARVAHDFHAAGLIDRYVLYLAPALSGGDDGRPVFVGPGAGTIEGFWRGRLISVERLGEDLRVEVAA
jgi:diaminohydroxyphosphoribosylaminopyrimidine deaminase/5-amino-6-(5-phosphoribosylamino)uracil reductase